MTGRRRFYQPIRSGRIQRIPRRRAVRVKEENVDPEERKATLIMRAAGLSPAAKKHPYLKRLQKDGRATSTTGVAGARTCNTDFIFHRRKLNYGLGEIRKDHPSPRSVSDFKLTEKFIADRTTDDKLPWEQYVKSYAIVDCEAEFRAMIEFLEDVSLVAISTESSTKDSYQESVTWIKLGTSIFTYVIDTKAVPLLVEKHLGQLLTNKLCLMVNGSDDIIRLREEFSVFLTAVFDIAEFVDLSGWRGAGSSKSKPMTFTSVIQAVLGESYSRLHKARKETFSRKSDWNIRPLSVQHLETLLGDMFYSFLAWDAIVSSTKNLEDLHNFRIQPMKEHIRSPAHRKDLTVSFEHDWRVLEETIRNNSPQDAIQSGDIQAKLLPLWELRKLVGAIHDRKPEIVISLDKLYELLVDRPASITELEEALRQERGLGEQVILRHSKDLWNVLLYGKDALDKILLRRCRTCLELGHIQQHCFMKSTSQTRARALALFQPERRMYLNRKRWMDWKNRKEDKRRFAPRPQGPRRQYSLPQGSKFSYGLDSAKNLYEKVNVENITVKMEATSRSVEPSTSSHGVTHNSPAAQANSANSSSIAPPTFISRNTDSGDSAISLHFIGDEVRTRYGPADMEVDLETLHLDN